MSMHTSISVTVHMPIHMSLCMSIAMSVQMFIHMSIPMTVHMSIHMSDRLVEEDALRHEEARETRDVLLGQLLGEQNEFADVPIDQAAPLRLSSSRPWSMPRYPWSMLPDSMAYGPIAWSMVL